MSKLSSLTFVTEEEGTIVTFTVPKEEVETIARYRYDRAIKDIKVFVQETVSSTVRWMSRMTAGLERFELPTLEHWKYDSRRDYLVMRGSRDFQTKFDMSFTDGSIEDYNQGLATILSSFWYKTHAVPTAVVELIAAADILYRERHDGVSPAAASGMTHVDVR